MHELPVRANSRSSRVFHKAANEELRGLQRGVKLTPVKLFAASGGESYPRIFN